MLFIGRQTLGKPNAQTTPSLKRHAAWEYPESAAHHKCLFGFRTPTHHVAQPDKRSIRFQKTNYFLTRPFLLRQNRQVKKGGIVGTPPSETRGTHLTVTRGTHCHPGHPHPDLPIKHTRRAFPIRTASRKSKRRLQSVIIRTVSINASAPQYIRITNMGYPDMIVRIID